MKKRLILSLLMCGLLLSCNGKDFPNNSNTTNNDQQSDKSSDTEPYDCLLRTGLRNLRSQTGDGQ